MSQLNSVCNNLVKECDMQKLAHSIEWSQKEKCSEVRSEVIVKFFQI